MAKTLTVKMVEQSKPTEKRQEIADAVVPGLYLLVQPSGKKSWATRFRIGGRLLKHTLGSWPDIGLTEARTAARKSLDEVARGRDPRSRAVGAYLDPGRDLFETVAAEFAERHLKTLKTSGPAEAMLLPVVRQWAGRKIGEITRRDVIELIDKIADRGAGIMANRTLALVRKLFNWARSRDIIDRSPCDGVKAPAPETKRDRVLSDEELVAVWRAANSSLGYPFGPLVKLLILTGQRREEVTAMTRDEVVGDLWTIPKERAKNGVAHQVPLSPQARAIIDALPGTTRYFFTTTGETPVSGFSRAKAKIDRMVPAPPWVIHDIRRTVATGMQRLAVEMIVVEKILNHVSGSLSGVAGVYQRHSYSEEKRRALERWADRVEELVR